MKKILIIAEAGVNHNGDINLALEMISKAKNAGADIIKFQTAKPELVISRFAQKAEYQKKTTGSDESQLEMCKKIHLKFEDYFLVKETCDKEGIQFLSTPFDIESIHFLNDMVPFWKIPSGEVTNYPYLVEIAKTGKPVVMSTGMCELSEIDSAIAVLKTNGTHEITLLHCNTQYPTPYKDVNLRAMETLRKRYSVKVGYSDHTQGIEVPIAAVALGAEVIEKHFTLDRTLPGPDHKASLEPDELAAMVKAIRNIEAALGNADKTVSDSERENIAIARKSIVAAKAIKKGELLNGKNITTKRPGTGLSPMFWNSVIGTKAIRDFQEDEEIEI